MIDADAPDRDTLEHVCMITRDQPCPIVLFSGDDDAVRIEQAPRAGVTSQQDLAATQNQLAARKLAMERNVSSRTSRRKWWI